MKEMFESLNAYLLGLDAVTTRIDGKCHGTIYSHGSRPFCRMDPKFRDAWIGVRIQGVDPAKIETVAKIRDRAEKYWIYLTDPGKLDQLKQVLRLAYEARR